MSQEIKEGDLKKGDLKDGSQSSGKELPDIQQFFKPILGAAGLMVVVFTLGIILGALGTVAIVDAGAINNAVETVKQIDDRTKDLQKTSTKLETTLTQINPNARFDQIDAKFKDLTEAVKSKK